MNVPLRGTLLGAEPAPEDELSKRLRVPPGFTVRRFADGIRGARMLRVTAAGDLLVSSPIEQAIYLVRADANGDGRADQVVPLLEKLARPTGLELADGWLYVGEANEVRRIRFDPETRATRGAFESVVRGLPEGGNHWAHTLALGPDGFFYMQSGSTCNACLEDDPRRAALLRFRPDGSGLETFATGLRNSVGFDWRPADGALYATDNGRDLLGDDFPPCELNRVERGKFYGWPFINGFGVPDPDYGDAGGERAKAAVLPAHGFGAHTAPLGMRFYRGNSFPERFRGGAFAALHGSWNRTVKSGYKVVFLAWEEDGTILESDFLTGFEVDGDVVGRPVDVVEGPDDSLYVSDDFAGAIYWIRYVGTE